MIYMNEITKKQSNANEYHHMLLRENSFEWFQQRSMEFTVLMSYYKCALMEIETKFNVLNVEYSLQYDRNPFNSIKSRLKKLDSILNKLQKQGHEVTVAAMEEHINDIAGIRVVCKFQDDVYVLADALLKQDDIELIEKKDYILNPKKNGYRSLHLIVGVPIFLANEKRIMKVEVQLRTIAMDSWASLEHQLRYKKDVSFTHEMEKKLQKCAELSAELDSRMQALRAMVKIENDHIDDDNSILYDKKNKLLEYGNSKNISSSIVFEL